MSATANMTKEQKLELLAAYTDAGLVEQARALQAEILKDELGVDPVSLLDKMGVARARVDDAMDKLADKLGVPRRKRP